MHLSTILALALPALASAWNPFRLPSSSSSSAPALKLLRRHTWGGAVSLGPTTSIIIKAVTTLTPGPAPPNPKDVLFLWPGMSNGTGHLVQTTLESWADNSWCGAGAATGAWCVRASLFGPFGQLDGVAGVVAPDGSVTIDYTLQADGTTWTQTATDPESGAVLSTFSYDSGPYMRGYGTGTECNGQCTGSVSAQKYTDTVITLAGGDLAFGDTIAMGQGARYEGLRSNADGSVWTIAKMMIPAMA